MQISAVDSHTLASRRNLAAVHTSDMQQTPLQTHVTDNAYNKIVTHKQRKNLTTYLRMSYMLRGFAIMEE